MTSTSARFTPPGARDRLTTSCALSAALEEAARFLPVALTGPAADLLGSPSRGGSFDAGAGPADSIRGTAAAGLTEDELAAELGLAAALDTAAAAAINAAPTVRAPGCVAVAGLTSADSAKRTRLGGWPSPPEARLSELGKATGNEAGAAVAETSVGDAPSRGIFGALPSPIDSAAAGAEAREELEVELRTTC